MMTVSIARQLVFDGLLELVHAVRGGDNWLNERHLHQRFSYLMQSRGLSLGLDGSEATLHPEWPTYREAASISYAQFKRTDLPLTWEYHVDECGGPGYLDFAIGPYCEPWIGIELTLKRNWVQEEIVFDLMKLLHPNMPFRFVAAVNVLLEGERSFFPGKRAVQNAMSTAYRVALQRLAAAGPRRGCAELLGLFVEVVGVSRRLWYLTASGQPRLAPEGMETALDLSALMALE